MPAAGRRLKASAVSVWTPVGGVVAGPGGGEAPKAPNPVHTPRAPGPASVCPLRTTLVPCCSSCHVLLILDQNKKYFCIKLRPADHHKLTLSIPTCPEMGGVVG